MVGPRTGRLTNRGLIPGRGKEFSLLHSTQTIGWAHLISHCLCAADKAAGTLGFHSRQVQRLMHVAITPLHQMPSRHGAYRGAVTSLARLGRKQARKHVRDARNFSNIETRDIKLFSPARQGNSRHSDRNISLFPSWSG